MYRDNKGRFCKAPAKQKAQQEKKCTCASKQSKQCKNTDKPNNFKKATGKRIDFTALYVLMTDKERERIKQLHQTAGKVLTMIDTLAAFKISYKNDPEASDAADDAILTLSMNLEELEYRMQKTWGIKQDAKFHTWWLKAHQCTCPVADNLDPVHFGLGPIINESCPIHGQCLDVDEEY